MKKALILIVCALSFVNANAQDFVKDGNYITVGYGLDPWGTSRLGFYKGYATYKHVGIGPIIATYERGITDVLGIGRIGVGGSLGFSSHTSSWYENYVYLGGVGNYEYKYNWTRFSIMAKAAYHFEFGVPRMDVYAGVGIGFNAYIEKWTSSQPNFNSTSKSVSRPSAFGHYEFVGIRYFFKENFGVYAEAGYGLAAINGGVVFKL